MTIPPPADDTPIDSSCINHPDVDLADPSLNSSGVPWHTLHYRAN